MESNSLRPEQHTPPELCREGLKTAITDFRPYGGTCALRGCDPKKVLIDGAILREQVQLHQGKRINGRLMPLN